MREAKLITVSRCGVWAWYSVNPSALALFGEVFFGLAAGDAAESAPRVERLAATG